MLREKVILTKQEISAERLTFNSLDAQRHFYR